MFGAQSSQQQDTLTYPIKAAITVALTTGAKAMQAREEKHLGFA